MGEMNNTGTVSKKQLAYDRIKEMIVNGEIKKESPLVERQLCDVLGISRTPVREALRALAADNLVEIIDGKGVYVKRIEFRDMVEIFEMREALERMAMKLFVERADDTAVGALQDYMKQQEEAYAEDDHERFMKIDMKIHDHIAKCAQNGRLRIAISNIYDQITQMAISARDDQQIRDMAMKAHRKIMDAVLKKDSEEAQRAIVEHVIEVRKMHMERYYLL